MTAAPILPERHEWTVDDLGDLPKDLPYELINGRLIVPSPTAVHQDLCVELLLTLRVNCPPEYLVSIDLSMRVDRRNEPRPDVVVIRRKHAGRSPVPVEDALLAVEVVSPTSTFRDMYDKAKVYAHAGIRVLLGGGPAAGAGHAHRVHARRQPRVRAGRAHRGPVRHRAAVEGLRRPAGPDARKNGLLAPDEE